jgi:mono/diheme cytochrome c family protein
VLRFEFRVSRSAFRVLQCCPGWPAAAAAIGIALGLAGPAARAQAPAPTPEDIAAGMRIFVQKGDCQACHGWAGDGRKMDSQMPDGANLRTSRLNRAATILAIKCGRPGRSMPAFDRLAYSDGRCYEMKLADLQRTGQQLPDPAATLQPREIEQLADFLFAKVMGKGPMTRAACIEYWGAEVEACRELEK